MAKSRKKRHDTPKRKAPPKPARRGASEDVSELLHELQVHSEAIAAQNAQLIKAQADIQTARDRYAELYDLAPAGYLLLDLHSSISECNFAACTILGRQRRFLLKVPLSALLVSGHRQPLREYLQSVDHDNAGRALEVELKGEPRRILRLVSKRGPSGSGAFRLFTTLTDVTVERNLEDERRAAFSREQTRSQRLADEVEVRTQAETRIKSLLERLVTVQEEERRRLSRDLHDQLGQQLTALRLALSMLKQVATGPEAQAPLDIAETIALRLDRDVDHLAWELRPAALDELGLAAALDAFVRQWSAYHRIKAEFHTDLDATGCGVNVENHLYRIVQEALNNVVKHANATEVQVTAERSHHLWLTVHDNGHGFDPSAARGKSGMGLLGMRERVALIGGRLEIESNARHGTTIVVHVPLSD